MNYSNLESKVLNFILDGDNAVLEILRLQRNASNIESIENTVVGLYFNYSNESYNGPTFKKDIRGYGDVEIVFPNYDGGCGAIIFTENGILSTLEIYSTDPLPDNLENLSLKYDKEDRDFSELDKYLPPDVI